MKRKVLGILLPFLAVTVLLGVFGVIQIDGTHAWFTDQDKSEENIISAGTVDPHLKAESFTVSNAIPGIWEEIDKHLYFGNDPNSSTIPIKYKISSEFVDESTKGFFDKIHIAVFKKGENDWEQYYKGLLKDLHIGPDQCSAMGKMDVGEGHSWKTMIMVDPSVGNEYQGAKTTFNLVFNSTQSNNTGWSE
jgi:predicted ribosomally synthesized peptide with SipW-like signal peptide